MKNSGHTHTPRLNWIDWCLFLTLPTMYLCNYNSGDIHCTELAQEDVVPQSDQAGLEGQGFF